MQGLLKEKNPQYLINQIFFLNNPQYLTLQNLCYSLCIKNDYFEPVRLDSMVKKRGGGGVRS